MDAHPETREEWVCKMMLLTFIELASGKLVLLVKLFFLCLHCCGWTKSSTICTDTIEVVLGEKIVVTLRAMLR